MNRAGHRGGLVSVVGMAVGIVVAMLVALAGCGNERLAGEPFEVDLTATYPEADAVGLFDAVVVGIEMELPPDVTSAFEPEVPEGFGGEVTLVTDRVGKRGTLRRWRLDLIAQTPGTLEIPAMRVVAGDVATTTPWKVTVRSLLEEGDSGDLEDPAPQFAEPEPTWPWVVGIAGAVLGALAILWLSLRWWRRRGGVAATPAHVVALRDLRELREAPMGSRVEMEAFCVRVSQVLRTYVEARFGVHAPERTSEEFLAELDLHEVFTGDQRQALHEFLQQCDFVKFAAVTRPRDVLSALVDTAENLVAATRGAPVTTATAEGAA